MNTEPHLPIYNEATELFKNKEYQKTVEKLNEFLEKVPDYTSGGYQIRAFCYYHLKDTKKSIADADYALKLGSTNAGLINLRGVCKLDLKDTEGGHVKILKELWIWAIKAVRATGNVLPKNDKS